MSIQNSQRVPDFRELKQILYRNPDFQPATVLALDTTNRVPGTPINNPTFSLPTPVKGSYAVSLKSLTLPVTWPNVTSSVGFEVTYGAVTGFPGSFTLPIGRYYYDNSGIVTYTTAAAAPATDFKDNLVYRLLIQMGGAITSIQIDPSDGTWNWEWDPSCVSVTTTSSDVPTFFKISQKGSLYWITSGTIDLVGPKLIMIGANLASGGYVASSTISQSYLRSCLPTSSFGDLLTHEPTKEHVTWFGQTKIVSNVTLAIIDSSTNLLLPLQADVL